MSDDVWEVYAIKYADHMERRRPESFLGGDPHDLPMPMFYYFWALVRPDRAIVVDTGFDAKVAARRERRLTRPVGDGLKALGVDPDSVRDVIITHLHNDHAGNDGLFPNARYHLQDCEMEFATGRCMCHRQMSRVFEVDDVKAMVGRVFDERVTFHDGAGEIAPGVTVHLIGGHSKGLQAVRVKTRRGFVALASDASHYYAHMEERRVFPIVYNLADVLDGYRKVAGLASSRDAVIPGHDPLVMDRYPSARPNMDGWAARLDADPARPAAE